MKVASRYLLPLELFLGFTMIAWGLSGGLGRGYLHKLLQGMGDDRAWLILLCGTGAVQMLWACFEWSFGKRWQLWGTRAWPPSLHQSVVLRCWAAFVSAFIWLYVVKLMFTVPGMRDITVLAMQAPGAFVISCWVFVENLKVAYALNPEIPTSTMRFDR